MWLFLVASHQIPWLTVSDTQSCTKIRNDTRERLQWENESSEKQDSSKSLPLRHITVNITTKYMCGGQV